MTGDTRKATSAAAYSWIVKARITEMFAGTPNLVLNVGCGWGRELVRFRNAVGIDLCLPYLKTARNYTPHDYVLADAEYLPFRIGVFSFICCAEVVEHLTDAKSAIDEMTRTLQLHGRLVIQTANRKWTRSRAISKEYLHVKELNKAELLDLVTNSGLRVERITGSTIPYIPTKSQFYWLNWHPFFFTFWKALNRLLPFKWDLVVCARKTLPT
jgi:ubiquinone/menaquinone biosynthesis C-methylase UbiE